MIEITEQTLASLRQAVKERMSPARLTHTLAVEDAVTRLCALYCPQEEPLLRAAALLHDLTKELRLDGQIELARTHGLVLTEADIASPKTLHARTAAALIPVEFPHLAHPTVIGAVRWHTVGREDMTLPEQLLYLADYIDASRTFQSCVQLRRFFWEAHPEVMSPEERLQHLRRTLLLSFRMTLKDLVREGALISPETVAARNALLLLCADDADVGE